MRHVERLDNVSRKRRKAPRTHRPAFDGDPRHVTPERFAWGVFYARKVADDLAEQRGTTSPTAIDPPIRTAVYLRRAYVEAGLAPDWMAADDWQDKVEPFL